MTVYPAIATQFRLLVVGPYADRLRTPSALSYQTEAGIL